MSIDRSIVAEEKRLMEEIAPEMSRIFKEFTGGSKVWLTTDFFKKVYREMCLAQVVICSLYEEVNELNAIVRNAELKNKYTEDEK